mgnify:CR=1 FL=1
MFEKLKGIAHNIMYDDNEEHRQKLKRKAIEYQQSIITKMKCPMCKSEKKTRSLKMRGWHDDPNIDYKKPDCYICCKCGYIMMFHNFSDLTNYQFEENTDESVVFKIDI